MCLVYPPTDDADDCVHLMVENHREDDGDYEITRSLGLADFILRAFSMSFAPSLHLTSNLVGWVTI